jgi:hypothetical protein
MRSKFFLIALLLSCASPVMAQRKKNLSTIGQGTLFFNLGYNRSIYSASNINALSPNYNFILQDVSGSDNPTTTGIGNYFDRDGFANLNFNAHIGYYIKPKWALTFGLDRLNYFMDSDQNVRLNGTIAPGAHSQWEGTHSALDVNLDGQNFYYRQPLGINYIRIGVLHSEELYKSKNGDFVIVLNTGVGVGLLRSNSQFTYDGLTNTAATGNSGFGLSAHVGTRFDIKQHVYIQMQFSGGMLNQGNVALDISGNASLSHTVGYFSPEVAIGFLVFARPTNSCGTCPQW